MRSLSARGRLEEHERTAQKMEAMARLAGGVAHDFNNMLSAIWASTKGLAADVLRNDRSEFSLSTILSATDRAEELTQQLLAFSRSQYLKPEVVELGELIERAVPIVRELVGAPIDVVVRVDPDLHRVRADRSQLDRILESEGLR